jgi:hypothetical protein
VVNDEIGGNERIDTIRVAAQFLDGVAHGGKVNDRWDASEVLEQDAGRHERVLMCVIASGGCPAGEGKNVIFANEAGHQISGAQQIFEQDAYSDRQTVKFDASLAGKRAETIDGGVFETLAKWAASAKRVGARARCCHNCHSCGARMVAGGTLPGSSSLMMGVSKGYACLQPV